MSDILLRVDDPSGVGEVRRRAERLARSIGFSDAGAGRVAIVASEAAGNLVKHAGHGEVILGVLPRSGLQILALDRGPGMRSPGDSIRDGCSTSGTSGTGLGAVQRLSNVFDLFSVPGCGTALLSRMWPDGVDISDSAASAVGAVSVPFPGEDISGDAWDEVTAGSTTVFVADGLGHGPEAKVAAEAARSSFREHAAGRIDSILRSMHERLRTTRGAAVALARVDPSGSMVEFAGVGNISGTVLSASERRSLVFQNGTVGGRIPAVRTGSEALPARGLLVLHTDGLTSHWSMASYPGLMARHPALVAGVLFRDFARSRDDATVIVNRATTA